MRKRYWVLISVFVCLAVLLVCCLEPMPVSEMVTIGYLEQTVQGAGLALCGDTVYEFEQPHSLDALCMFHTWQEAQVSRQTGKPADAGEFLLSIKIGDLYELAFYGNGFAYAYYGYASYNVQDHAWYSVPEDVARELIEYIEDNGTLRQPYLGPESWFAIHK